MSHTHGRTHTRAKRHDHYHGHRGADDSSDDYYDSGYGWEDDEDDRYHQYHHHHRPYERRYDYAHPRSPGKTSTTKKTAKTSKPTTKKSSRKSKSQPPMIDTSKVEVKHLRMFCTFAAKSFRGLYPADLKPARTDEGERYRDYMGTACIIHGVQWVVALAFVGFGTTYSHIVLTALSYSVYLTLSDLTSLVYCLFLAIALSEFLHSTTADEFPCPRLQLGVLIVVIVLNCGMLAVAALMYYKFREAGSRLGHHMTEEDEALEQEADAAKHRPAKGASKWTTTDWKKATDLSKKKSTGDTAARTPARGTSTPATQQKQPLKPRAQQQKTTPAKSAVTPTSKSASPAPTRGLRSTTQKGAKTPTGPQEREAVKRPA